MGGAQAKPFSKASQPNSHWLNNLQSYSKDLFQTLPSKTSILSLSNRDNARVYLPVVDVCLAAYFPLGAAFLSHGAGVCQSQDLPFSGGQGWPQDSSLALGTFGLSVVHVTEQSHPKPSMKERKTGRGQGKQERESEKRKFLFLLTSKDKHVGLELPAISPDMPRVTCCK